MLSAFCTDTFVCFRPLAPALSSASGLMCWRSQVLSASCVSHIKSFRFLALALSGLWAYGFNTVKCSGRLANVKGVAHIGRNYDVFLASRVSTSE